MQLEDWVNPTYLAKRVLRPMQRPFPHLVLRDFFLKSRADTVARALLKERFVEKDADLFRFEQTADVKHSKNAVLQEWYAFFTSSAWIRFVSEATRVRLSRSVDMSGFIYDSADYLLPHDDRLAGRRIAYILNLSKGFTKKDGGELELFTTRNGHHFRRAKVIPPVFNTLTLFEVTPRSFHQVREVLSNKKRLSMGGWFHG